MALAFIYMLVLYLIAALASVVLAKWQRVEHYVGHGLCLLASLLGFSVSLLQMNASQSTALFSINASIPLLSLSFSLDRLSAFFILCLSLLTFCVSLYSLGYLTLYYQKRRLWLFNLLYVSFILSIVLLLTADGLISFLIFWEIMALLSYILVVFEGEKTENSEAGVIYLIMTHVGTAFLLIGLMLIYTSSGSLTLAPVGDLISPGMKNVIFILLLIGFGVKAGVIPLHIWLPGAYAAAPANVSALMSGIMSKTAIYGLLRFVLGVLGISSPWWGTLILLLGMISAVLGIAYALMARNIKRLLAYSSIENIGIILIGLGISFSAAAKGQNILASFALLAALYHSFNHTLFKGALFLGAGSLFFATGSKELDELGGLVKTMPVTSLFLIFASLSISALPPFNGFISEWLTYQVLFMDLSLSGPGLKMLLMLGVAALAMAGAMATFCFVKLVGITLLGLPRTPQAQAAKEVPLLMQLGMGLLTFFCLIFGLFPQLMAGILDKLNQELFLTTILPKLEGNAFFIFYPLNYNALSIAPINLFLTGLVLIIGILLLLKLIRWKRQKTIYTTWDCGFGALNARTQYTATGYSKPMRIVMRWLFQPIRDLQVDPGTSPYFPKSITYRIINESVFEKYLYRPLAHFFTRWATQARMLIHTGSVHTYLLYIFVTLIALLIYNRVS